MMSDKLLEQILQELKEMRTEQQTLDKRISTIETNMATKQDVVDISAIKVAVLETNTDVKEIKHSVQKLEQIQVDQQRIIELLSARSLQQEAELKRIK